jgi:hypothetical protein
MEIILKIKDKTYLVSKNIGEPDTDNVMYGIESLITSVPELDKKVIEEYVLAWAEEIKNKG